MYEYNVPRSWENAAPEIAKDLLDRYFKDDWTGEVNSPKLTRGMTAVYWDDANNERTLTSDNSETEWNNWYNYVAGDNVTDSKMSKWANAKITKDGVDSYFVWIPRYEYKILSGEGTSEAGPIEVKFIPTTQTTPDEGYKIHPAFTNGTANNFKNGEWDKELPGIWVGKYETSHSDATESSEGSSDALTIVPNVQSWRNITMEDSYTTAYNYDRAKESHMMKNSEWGAVAYLTHSQYGRNGHEIDVNNSSNYITGSGGEGASTTGNIFGIYDLSGGAWENVAAYIANGDSSLSSEGLFVATTTANPEGYKTLSTKYATVYPYNSSSDKNTDNYTTYKKIAEESNGSYGYGDAILETSNADATSCWFGDSISYPYTVGPFFTRGSCYLFADNAICGIFAFDRENDPTGDYSSFRVVLSDV